MGLFDWISNQVDTQVERIQQAEKERLEAKKKWLANPYGMDPELQERLVAEATKKREEQFASELSRVPKLFDPQADYQRNLTGYNARKSREEDRKSNVANKHLTLNSISTGYNARKSREDRKSNVSNKYLTLNSISAEEQKKSDKEFEARRRQRVAENLFKNTFKKGKVPPTAISMVNNNLKASPVILTSTIQDASITAPSVTSTTVPIIEPAELSPSQVSEAIYNARAKIQTDTLEDHAFQELGDSSAPQICPPTLVVFLTPCPVPGSLAFLRNDPGFLQIRDAIQQNHALLFPFVEEIKMKTPELAILLFHNEEEFRGLLAETWSPVIVPQLPADLLFLEHDERFLTLRRAVQQHPEELAWAMQKLVEESPDLAAILACNEAHFIHWLNIGSRVRIGPVNQDVDLDAAMLSSPTLADTNSLANLNFLYSNLEFLKIRAAYRVNPEMLTWLVGEFLARNPDLKSMILSNEAEFIRLMNEEVVPPAEDSSHLATDGFDNSYLSPLSQRLKEADENKYRNTRDPFEKQVRFTDSVIRRDNTMDFSPLRNKQPTQPDMQYSRLWMNGLVDTHEVSDAQANNSWTPQADNNYTQHDYDSRTQHVDDSYRPQYDDNWTPQVNDRHTSHCDDSWTPQTNDDCSQQHDNNWMPQTDDNYTPQYDDNWTPYSARQFPCGPIRPFTPTDFNRSTASFNQPPQNHQVDFSHRPITMTLASNSGGAPIHMAQQTVNPPAVQPLNNTSSIPNIFAPNPMFKSTGFPLPGFGPAAIVASAKTSFKYKRRRKSASN